VNVYFQQAQSVLARLVVVACPARVGGSGVETVCARLPPARELAAGVRIELCRAGRAPGVVPAVAIYHSRATLEPRRPMTSRAALFCVRG